MRHRNPKHLKFRSALHILFESNTLHEVTSDNSSEGDLLRFHTSGIHRVLFFFCIVICTCRLAMLIVPDLPDTVVLQCHPKGNSFGIPIVWHRSRTDCS